MTEKLYDLDSHLFAFTATVTACEKTGRGYAVALDRTAFFPEGGGQSADTGRLGAAFVTDVREKDGVVYHMTDAPLPVGATVEGALDGEKRLRRMQNHSGEHIVSGLAHRLYGLNNVGFHMGERCMTIDFDGELTAAQLENIETRANVAVRANVPVRAWYPSAEELATLDYRSKKEIEGAVRLVAIEGVDLCACCAPHVARTGEIGLIKILDAMRHRGGMRVELICGMDALDEARRKQESVTAVSRALSVPRENIAFGVERLLSERERQKERVASLSRELVRLYAERCGETAGNLCVFDSLLDEIAQRELCNRLADKCGGFAAVFTGSDEEGWRYIIASRHVDLRALTRRINAAVGGRGGGSAEMIQGRAAAREENIRQALLDR